jgi:hypothetical protein
MYKCETCKTISQKGETQFKIFTYNYRTIGFDIASEKKVCKLCYDKSKLKFK